jgi:hypothetical protein
MNYVQKKLFKAVEALAVEEGPLRKRLERANRPLHAVSRSKKADPRIREVAELCLPATQSRATPGDQKEAARAIVKLFGASLIVEKRCARLPLGDIPDSDLRVV